MLYQSFEKVQTVKISCSLYQKTHLPLNLTIFIKKKPITVPTNIFLIMDPTFFPTPSDFRQWLEENHDKKKELWVGYYRKSTKIPSINWPQSVREALCYGWIDGLRKSIDEKSYKIRFTPRRRNSHWSQVNLKMVDELIKNGKMQPAGLKIYQKRNPAKEQQFSYEREAAQLTEEYLEQIKAQPKAWDFFQNLPPGYKKQTVHWVMQAKREATRQKRLTILIESATEGKRVPHLRR
jgi:uncharacterized protein YdeI (YjbR/CyaY-like superfamily)